MATISSATLTERVARDSEAFVRQTPSSAIGALVKIAGLRYRDRCRPYQAVLQIAENRPEILDRLGADQRQAIATMLLTRLLLESRDSSDATRQRLSGSVLAARWAELPESLRHLFGAHTGAAVERLAQLATRERDVCLPSAPVRLGHALSVDGATRKWLCNGCLDDEHSSEVNENE